MVIKVGLVGYGMAGRVFHAPLLRAEAGLALVGIATSRSEEVRALDPALTCYPSPEDLFADPAIDLVVIATPNATHAPLAEAALRAGKHVVVDKPFALTLAEAEALVALARVQDRRLMVFHNRRWDSDFLTICAAIEDGLVGEVLHFESHFDRFRPAPRDRWREDGGAGSGVWFDLGPHIVDQALVLFGRPGAVSGDLAALRPGARSDDWAHVELIYPDKRVLLHASLCVAGGTARFSVHGTKGSIIKPACDPQEDQLVAGLRPGDAGWGEDPDPLQHWDASGTRTLIPATTGHQQSYYAQVAATLAHDAPPPITPQAMLDVQAVIDAASLSAREGRVVAL
jgi:predicted dehydrogenase